VEAVAGRAAIMVDGGFLRAQPTTQ